MGQAQAHGAGHRDPGRKLRYDLLYISTMGPWLDIRLCALCVFQVLRAGPPRSLRAGGRRPSPRVG